MYPDGAPAFKHGTSGGGGGARGGRAHYSACPNDSELLDVQSSRRYGRCANHIESTRSRRYADRVAAHAGRPASQRAAQVSTEGTATQGRSRVTLPSTNRVGGRARLLGTYPRHVNASRGMLKTTVRARVARSKSNPCRLSQILS